MTVLLYDQIKDDIFNILKKKDPIKLKHLDDAEKQIKRKLIGKTYSYKELKELINFFKKSMKENGGEENTTKENLKIYYKEFLKQKDVKNVSLANFIAKKIGKIVIQFFSLLIIILFVILKFYDFNEYNIKYEKIEYTNIYTDYISNKTLNNCNKDDKKDVYICNKFNDLKETFNQFDDSTELTVWAMIKYIHLTMIINENNLYNLFVKLLIQREGDKKTTFIEKINSEYNLGFIGLSIFVLYFVMDVIGKYLPNNYNWVWLCLLPFIMIFMLYFIIYSCILFCSILTSLLELFSVSGLTHQKFLCFTGLAYLLFFLATIFYYFISNKKYARLLMFHYNEPSWFNTMMYVINFPLFCIFIILPFLFTFILCSYNMPYKNINSLIEVCSMVRKCDSNIDNLLYFICFIFAILSVYIIIYNIDNSGTFTMINIILAGCTFFIFLFFYQTIIKNGFFYVNKPPCDNPSNPTNNG